MPQRLLTRRSIAFGAILLAAGCAARVDAPPRSVLFFNAQSGELDDPARGMIAEFVKDATAAPRLRVYVAGYADKIGTSEANRKLSAFRAQVVADALVERGIARERIVQRPRGETGADPGIESRRVELSLGI